MLEFKKELIHIADIIAAQFGPSTEVVVHDFTDDPDHTIIYILNGHISGRKIGDGVNKTFLQYVNLSDHGSSKVRLVTHSKDGRIIRSSSANFFDDDGSLCGCLCINQDITNLVALENAFKGMTEDQYFDSHVLPGDADNDMQSISIHGLMDGIIAEGLAMIGTPPDKMNKESKIQLLKYLDEKGVFLIQKSGQKVCQLLGISKFTLYNYLDEVREK